MALGLGIANELLETPTLWTPREQGLNDNLLFWLENNNDISASAWLDQSDNQNDTTQSTTLYQPSVARGGLRFNGTSDYHDFDTKFTIAQRGPFTVCMAFYLTDNTTRCFLSDGASEFMEIMTGKKLRFKGAAGGGLTTTLASSNTIFPTEETIIMVLGRNEADEFKLHINGDEIPFTLASTNTTNNRGFDVFNLGIRNDNDRHFSGDIFEIFMHNKFLSPSQIENATNYLKSKQPF